MKLSYTCLIASIPGILEILALSDFVKVIDAAPLLNNWSSISLLNSLYP